ncbi:MAG: hypothetical protein JWP89_1394 [Schlesneria sp.]|nr:hypothetical protein [Schlesneria sp.]
MHTFFQGWRRKAGGVTLLMACVVTGMWVRARQVDDVFGYSLFGMRYIVATSADGLRLWQWNEAEVEAAHANQHSVMINWGEIPGPDDFRGLENWPLYAEVIRTVIGTPDQVWYCEVTYWPLTIPLILLSAYLILWKPRKRPSPI